MTYSTGHSTKQQQNTDFFSCVHETFTKTNHILCRKIKRHSQIQGVDLICIVIRMNLVKKNQEAKEEIKSTKTILNMIVNFKTSSIYFGVSSFIIDPAQSQFFSSFFSHVIYFRRLLSTVKIFGHIITIPLINIIVSCKVSNSDGGFMQIFKVDMSVQLNYTVTIHIFFFFLILILARVGGVLLGLILE